MHVANAHLPGFIQANEAPFGQLCGVIQEFRHRPGRKPVVLEVEHLLALGCQDYPGEFRLDCAALHLTEGDCFPGAGGSAELGEKGVALHESRDRPALFGGEARIGYEVRIDRPFGHLSLPGEVEKALLQLDNLSRRDHPITHGERRRHVVQRIAQRRETEVLAASAVERCGEHLVLGHDAVPLKNVARAPGQEVGQVGRCSHLAFAAKVKRLKGGSLAN